MGSTLPAAYDLRNSSRVPAVRNQNPFGTCWAHAAIGSMESNYLTQKLAGKMSHLGDAPDLSELHMAWFVYKDPEEGHSFTIGSATYGKGVLGQGGNVSRSTAYLARMAGAVDETSMPYSLAGGNADTADNKATTQEKELFSQREAPKHILTTLRVRRLTTQFC